MIDSAFVPSPSAAWTLAVLPDTQNYCHSFPDMFLRQTEWIVANRKAHNILFVAHEGDIVHRNLHGEWLHARKAMDVLRREKIPFSLAVGNHDLGRWGFCETRETFLNDYFCYSDYRNSERSGYYNDRELENSWHHLSTPTGPFMILVLEFGPRDEVLKWADQIAAQNSDRRIIIVTHAFLYSDGTRYDFAERGTTQKWNPKEYPLARKDGEVNDAEEMWRKFISKHRNIIAVLSGHVMNGGVAYLASKGEHGNVVHQLLANYQSGCVPDRPMGGGGFLRLMHFMPDGRTIEVRSYSPYSDEYLTDEANHFTITLTK